MGEDYSDDFQWQDDSLPWDEFKWEQFMQEQDEKAERYLEKFIKSKDLPNCEELIAHELSWDYGDEEENDDFNCPYDDMNCEECPHRTECDVYLEESDSSPADKFDYEMLADFRKDPIWKESYELAIRLQFLSSLKLDLSNQRGPLFELLLNSRMVPAKIAGAFGIGFHVDVIGGNIANHKRALVSTLKCLEALNDLETSEMLPPKLCAKYRKGLFDMRENLMRRIDELRVLFHKLLDEG